MADLVIKNAKVVIPGQNIEIADVVIDGQKISQILPSGSEIDAVRTLEAGGQYLLPGVIDSHTHYGYGDPEDDFRIETASAARGGVTTVIEYYRQTGTYLDLDKKIEVIDRKSHINVGLHLALMGEHHFDEVEQCYERYGIPSFKCWMSRREYAPGQKIVIQGVEEGELFQAMERVREVPGGVLALHAENLEVFELFRNRVPKDLDRSLKAWHLARPASAEAIDILKAGYISKKTGCPIHIVHLGSLEALEAIRVVRDWGVNITFETTPYFLTHTVEHTAGRMAKVNPPVREQQDVDAMWAALSSGEADIIGTDHAAKPRSQKKLDGTIWETAPGFPGTFTMLPVLLSEGVNKGRIDLQTAVKVLSERPAELFGLANKGKIEIGKDADLILVDLDLKRVVTAELQASVADYSIYEGTELKGWATTTILGGEVIVENDRLLNRPGDGSYQRRTVAT